MIENDIKCDKILQNGPFFQEMDEEIVLNELLIRSNLRHPFLINQVCAFQDYDNLFYIYELAITKLMKNNLLPKKPHVDLIIFYADEIFSCLRHFHSKKQIYTFLTFDNIYL